MTIINPVVIRGGFGKNKDKSITSGAFILDILRNKYFDPTDLLVDKEGWFVDGKKVKTEDIHKLGDIFISSLSEDNHEDFDVRKKLERLGVHFIGSPTDSSLLSFNKHGSKELFKEEALQTPPHKIFQKSDDTNKTILEIFRSFGLPVILKPVSSNYSISTSLAETRKDLRESLKDIFSVSDKVLVETFIPGREVSCLLLENYRNQPLYAFPLGEIVRQGKISDQKTKRDSLYGVVFPARVSVKEAETIRESAIKAHKVLDLSHYSRADFIVSPRGIYLLEINSSPELSKNSLLHQSIEAGGMTPEAFLEHLINLAIG